MHYFYGVFPKEIQQMIPSLVSASVQIFEDVKKTLLPTPAKSHYLFNLRDLSKMFQGMSQAKPKFLLDKADITRLWWHENRRVYEDRLISDEDREKIEGLIEREMQINLKTSFQELRNFEQLIFTTIMNENSRTEGYKQVVSINEFVVQIEKYLEQFNLEVPAKKQMNLVMFKNACEYVVRIASVLNNPQGHIVLLGVGGSGRQSLSRLASYIVNLPTF